MTPRMQFGFSAIVIALMAAGSVWAWNVAPQITEVPVHWNLAGEAVAFRSKDLLLIGPPLIALVLSLVLGVLSRGAVDVGGKLLRAIWAGGLLALAAVHVFFVLGAAGLVHSFGNYTALFPAVFFMIVGNYMAKRGFGPEQGTGQLAKPAARRWLGRMLVLTGIATCATWLAVPGPASELVMVAGGLGSALVAAIVAASRTNSLEGNGGVT